MNSLQHRFIGVSNESLAGFKLLLVAFFLLPVGATARLGGMGFNLSVSDVLLIPLLCKAAELRRTDGYISRIEKRYFAFSLCFIALMSLSVINICRYVYPPTISLLLNSLAAMFKIVICLLYGGVFLVYFVRMDRNAFKLFLRIGVYSGLMFGLSCIAGAVLAKAGIETSLSAYGSRGSGFLDDPNLSAELMLMQPAYALVLLTNYKEERRNAKIYFSLLCMLIGLLATGSKAGLLDLVFVVGVALLILFFLNRPVATLAGLSGVAFLALLLIALNSQLGFMNTLISRLGELTGGDANEAMTGRAGLWEYSFHLLNEDFNFFTGVGIGLFKPLMIQNMGSGNLAHNTFLSFLSECGILTAGLILFAVISRMTGVISRLFSTEKYEYLSILAGLLSAFVYMNSVNLQNNRMTYVFLIFVTFVLEFSKTVQHPFDINLSLMNGDNR